MLQGAITALSIRFSHITVSLTGVWDRMLSNFLIQTYNAGLNGDFTSPGVSGRKMPLTISRRVSLRHTATKAENDGEYTRDSHRAGRWAAVLHPFWDPDAAFAANSNLSSIFI